MFGTGILKGLGVTLKDFVDTYVDDVKKIPSRYAGGRDEHRPDRTRPPRTASSPSSIPKSGASCRSASATSRC